MLLKHILRLIDSDKTSTGPELVGRVDLLDAVLWWVSAWNLVTPETITKCFRKCGFPDAEQMEVDPAAETPAASTAEPRPDYERLLPEGVTMEDYCAVDDDVQTTMHEVLGESETEPEEEDEVVDAVEEPVQSLSEILLNLHRTRRYSMTRGVAGVNEFVSKIETLLSEHSSRSAVQSSLDSWIASWQ